jgi:hypothetical protein
MLERLRGKRLVFVGDSLNRNMWESLVCILRNSVRNKTKLFEVSGRSQFKAQGAYSFLFQVDVLYSNLCCLYSFQRLCMSYQCANFLLFRITIAAWSSSAPPSLSRNGRCQSDMEKVPGKPSDLTLSTGLSRGTGMQIL